MPPNALVGGVLVDSSLVVLEVGVDGERGLNGSPGHDSGLDGGYVVGVELDGSLEAVLVGLEVVVGGLGVTVAAGRSTRSGLGLAAGVSLGGVGVLSLVPVVVAVGQRKGGAEVLSPEGVRLSVSQILEVLGSSDDSGVFEELPGGVELSSVASRPLGVEAGVLATQGNRDGSVSANAKTVTRSASRSECPAATAVRLIADVADHLGAGGEGGDTVEGAGDGVLGSGEEGSVDEKRVVHIVGTGLKDGVGVLFGGGGGGGEWGSAGVRVKLGSGYI